MVETFLVSLSLRWGFDDDDDDRGGLGFMRANWPWRVRLGVLEQRARRQTGWDVEQAPTTPETDTGHAARALTTHTDLLPLRDNQRHGRKKRIRILRSRAAAWRLTGLSLFFHRTWRPFSGRGRLPAPDVHLRSEPRTGMGDGTGTEQIFTHHLYHGLGWVDGEVREGVIGGRHGEVSAAFRVCFPFGVGEWMDG